MPLFPPDTGGGGTPGGSDTQLQFNNAGVFGGTELLYSLGGGSVDLTIPDSIVSDTAGNAIEIYTGAGLGTGAGGGIRLDTGRGGVTGPGGTILLDPGNGGATSGDGGSFDVTAGNATNGAGGYVSIVSGSAVTGNGGALSLTAAGGSVTNGLMLFTQLDGNYSFMPLGGTNQQILSFQFDTSSHTFEFPNTSGTVALTSDISGQSRSVGRTSGSTSALAATNTDYVYIITGAHTVTMPDASTVGNNRYTLKNIHSANVSLAFTGGQTADGGGVTLIPNQSVDLVQNGLGTGWVII